MHVKAASAPAAVTLVPHELVRSARLFAVLPLDLDSALSSARPRGDTSIHAGDVWPRTHLEQVLTGSRLLHAPHLPGGQASANVRRVHMKRARTCAACTPQLAQGIRTHAARRPARPPPRRHKRITTRARANAARRPATRGVIGTFAPGNGNDITHLQDHFVVDSNIFNARLHVLSCDVG